MSEELKPCPSCSTLARENDRLRLALLPFARMALELRKAHGATKVIHKLGATKGISVNDLQHALQAIGFQYVEEQNGKL